MQKKKNLNKKVGVIFCGGCNPAYDRLEKYEELKKKYPLWEFEYFNPDYQYDKVVIINGCKSVCMEDERKKYNAYLFSDINDNFEL